jgi:sugar/nucleoside kinase (ribokinase family)
MPSKHKIDVLGIGNPIMDHLVKIDDTFLERIPGENYGTELIDYPGLVALLKESKKKPILMPGGSAANALKGLANLGINCAMIGKIGKDEVGHKFEAHMQSLGITSLLKKTDTPTAHVACFITPDGKRTMRSYMGASKLLSADDLDKKAFEGVRIVHIGGYTLFIDDLTETAMKMAKEAGAIVSFDLGSFELAGIFRKRIHSLIRDYVDVLFGNEDEMHALTLKDLDQACDTLKSICPYVAIMLGKKGCLIGHEHGKFYFEGYPVNHPLDTTGAGDLFASGFLYGLLKGKSVETCAKFGSLTGSNIVQVLGTEIPKKTWQKIKAEIIDKIS